MEMTCVKTSEQLRAEWIHRPAHLMHLSLHEYEQSLLQTDETEQPAAAAEDSVGRVQHQTGKMNKLEAKYAAHLDLRKTTGEIMDWRFEPMKLRLAPRTYFDIDFIVVRRWRATEPASTYVELHEVKGHWEDDARVKMKVSATMFPWWKFKGVQWDKATKDWKFEEFNAQ